MNDRDKLFKDIMQKFNELKVLIQIEDNKKVEEFKQKLKELKQKIEAQNIEV